MTLSYVSIPSPHDDGTHRPRAIVVHAMAEFLELGERDQSAWEFLESVRLSCHVMVTSSGTLVRTLPDERVGRHARGHNTGWLGIELLVATSGAQTYGQFFELLKTDWVTDAQWCAAVAQVRHWRAKWSIPVERIRRHSDLDPGRKFDPGPGFAWRAFLEAVGP